MITRILIPFDFSENSLLALPFALDLAKRYEAELLLVHVVDPFYYVAAYAGPDPVRGAEILRAEVRSAGNELIKLAEPLRQQGAKCRTLVKEGTAYIEIVNVARDEHVDMIVMATHGRTGVSRLLIGSVAEKVVRTSECPVLTVHGQATKKAVPTSA